MKTLAVATALAFAPAAILAAPETFELDPEHTTVAFLVEHVGFAKILGRFNEVSGTFTYDADTQTLSDVRVVVPVATIDTDNEARDNHVRSADFLDADANPEMIFTATSGQVTGDGTGVVEGELTLRGETHPITLNVMLNKSGVYPFGHQKFTLGVSVRGTVNRSTWGMDYGVANGLVGDEVELIVELEALQQE